MRWDGELIWVLVYLVVANSLLAMSLLFAMIRAGEVARVSANRWDMVRTAYGWRVRHRENALLDGSEGARALLAHPAI